MHIPSLREPHSKLTEDRRILAAAAVAAAALIAIAAILMAPVPVATRRPLVARLAARLASRRPNRPDLEMHAEAARRHLTQMASAIAGSVHEAKASVDAVLSDLARRWDHARSATTSRRG